MSAWARIVQQEDLPPAIRVRNLQNRPSWELPLVEAYSHHATADLVRRRQLVFYGVYESDRFGVIVHQGRHGWARGDGDDPNALHGLQLGHAACEIADTLLGCAVERGQDAGFLGPSARNKDNSAWLLRLHPFSDRHPGHFDRVL